MNQTYELRVLEKHAHLVFSHAEGERLGRFVRKVVLRDDDPRLEQIRVLDAELMAAGDAFFGGWAIHRHYTRTELLSAELLHLKITSVFEPPAEDFGTSYDDQAACLDCGSGAPRITPLILDPKTIPRRDVARTIADEVVVSRKAAELFRRERVSGIDFQPVYVARTVPLIAAPNHQEPVVEYSGAEIVAPTRLGSGLFGRSEDHAYRCPRGDLLGLNLLSELWIRTSTRGADDVIATRQFVGVRRGDLRPFRCLLVSSKVAQILLGNKLTGFKLEIAHLVPEGAVAGSA